MTISGDSSSGKTILAALLKKHYSESAVLIFLYLYYKDLSAKSEIDRDNTSFDHPDSIDFKLFKNDVEKLNNNEIIDMPRYSFVMHCRSQKILRANPSKIIILEGLYAFYDQTVSELADYKVYVDANDDIRLISFIIIWQNTGWLCRARPA